MIFLLVENGDRNARIDLLNALSFGYGRGAPCKASLPLPIDGDRKPFHQDMRAELANVFGVLGHDATLRAIALAVSSYPSPE
jgi:hypothetical protein